jgi:DNA modification methylase
MNLICGDALEELRKLDPESVQCCVTSPPYWGLRDYGVDGQLGLEKTPEKYTTRITEVFREVRRVLRDDGTLWLNLGDSYWNGGAEKRDGGHGFVDGGKVKLEKHKGRLLQKKSSTGLGLKPKDLIGTPWRVAFALQADGWYLRSDIIWAKPNPMPESMTDRPTRAHEYLFLMSKSAHYYYDAEAIREPVAVSQTGRTRSDAVGGKSWAERNQHSPGGVYMKNPSGWDTGHGPHTKLVGRYKDAKDLPDGQANIRKVRDKQRGHGRRHVGFNDRWDQMTKTDQQAMGRNKRDVWIVATQPYPEVHFATFPARLIRPCVLAGCPVGGTVLDPFMGSGTTGVAAENEKRNFVGIELNPEYLEMARARIQRETAQQRLPL